MHGAITLPPIRGIHVYIHWTFLLLFGWIVLVNTEQENTLTELFWSVLFVLAVFACVLLHELGHSVVAARFGIKANNIVLLPVGGVAAIEKFPDNPRQELLISFAGPLVNVFIALLLTPFFHPYALLSQGLSGNGISHATSFLYSLYIANIVLAVFNLAPAFPLDGGRIFRALLALVFRINYIRATTIASFTGKLVAVIFIGAGIILFNPILPLIGIFIIFAASTEEYYLRLRSLVKGIKLKEVMMYDYNSLEANMPVKEAANILLNNHSDYFILMDNGTPIGSINRMEIIKAVAEMKYELLLKQLLKEDLQYLQAEEDVDNVLERLAGSDNRVYPVMENSHFAGVINFSHLIEYLLLHKATTKEYGRVRSLVGLIK